ncbi:MAG: hypothetical protein WAZ99_10230 [Rectinemataceae bacterium]
MGTRRPASREVRHRTSHAAHHGTFHALYGALLFLVCACTPGGGTLVAAAGDLRPPSVLDAGPTGPGSFVLDFDEEVRGVSESFYLEPGPVGAEAISEGCSLRIEFDPPLSAGAEYRLAGEAEDKAGNATRFLFSFLGWNDNPPLLRLNEIQPGKNSSKSSPHRDYLEFLVVHPGDLGGITVEWTSSVKDCEWKFPPCMVKTGEFIVLHVAPEGIPEEKNEIGADLAISGGIDASAEGRDFWCDEGPLPDENALVLVRARPGEAPMDGVFYANEDKTGDLDSDRIGTRLAELAEAGLWKSATKGIWEDAFRWNSSTSRPLHRAAGEGTGTGIWSVGETGSQSPGVALPVAPKKSSSTRRVKGKS